VIKSVKECLDLLLTFFDFAVKLITIALQFFFLLGSLDDVVSLRVFTLSFNFARA